MHFQPPMHVVTQKNFIFSRFSIPCYFPFPTVVLHKIPHPYIKREILQIYPTPPILAFTAHDFFLCSQTTPKTYTKQ